MIFLAGLREEAPSRRREGDRPAREIAPARTSIGQGLSDWLVVSPTEVRRVAGGAPVVEADEGYPAMPGVNWAGTGTDEVVTGLDD
jgi:hypothetical protein